VQTLLERVHDLGIRIRFLDATNSQLVEENAALRRNQNSTPNNSHVETLKAHLGDPNFDLWTYGQGGPKTPPADTAIPILSIINFKGGVDKTTLASSLASYLSAKQSGCRQRWSATGEAKNFELSKISTECYATQRSVELSFQVRSPIA
jgi:hypothetical protein